MAQNNRPKGVWRETSETFVNPYNFIPLGEEVIRSVPQYGSLTGRIRCKLTVKTPLAIPDTSRRTEEISCKEHYHYPFFSIDSENKPVHLIPGSSLRGVLRSTFETVTNSCLSANNNNILSSRNPTPRRPGILVKENGKWVLYNAKKKKFFSDTRPADGNSVIRKWYSIDRKKVTYSLFTIEDAVNCSDLEEAVEDYRECIEIYRKNAAENRFFDKNFCIDEGKPNPLFYEIVYGKNGKKNVYLSPAQISRSVYRNKLNDLLGSHCSCGERAENDGLLCEACSLFGIINKKTSKATAGKIRVTDAHEKKFISAGYKTLKELASPKTTAVEFYTERPKDTMVWNYDYITKSYDKQKDERGRNIKIPKRKLEEIRVRGRKFYFHSTAADYETKEKTKRNSTMELADIGSVFEFDIYFDGISEKHLSELVFAVTLGENSDESTLMHKLGHGKPLGLGSVKITVEGIELRNFDKENGIYSVSNHKAEEYLPIAGIALTDEMKAMFDLNTVKQVSYPIAVDKTSKSSANASASHQWFAANRMIGGTGTDPNIKYILPMIKAPKLPTFEKDFVNSNTKPKTYSSGDNWGGGSIQIKKKRK